MVATLIMTVFFVAFSGLYKDNLRHKKEILARDYGFSLQNEFFMAAQAKPGYIRTFTVPEKLEGFTFEAKIINSVLIINYTESVFSLPIPVVQGNIKKGKNTITKTNQTICVNC